MVICFFLAFFSFLTFAFCCDFLDPVVMATSLRIVTIAKGEQAIIKVNSAIPLTLEFEGHSITLWARSGMVFQRLETTAVETQVEEEIDAEPYEETQVMDSESDDVVLPEHVTIRSRLTTENKIDLQDLQTELFYLDAGETQLME